MSQKSLQDVFVDEVRDIYDAERQITRALPKMIKKATSKDLRTALENHLEETNGHIERLEQVFGELDENVRGKHCDGVAGLLEEGKATMEEDMDEEAMDAALIGAGQRVEHYEMAAYGTLLAWAGALGHREVAALLKQNLAEEKAADAKLNKIAEGGVNQKAAKVAGQGDRAGKNGGKSKSESSKGARAVATRR